MRINPCACVLGLLVACNKDAPAAAGGGASSAQVSAASTTAPTTGSKTSCDLLSKADAEAIFGEPFEEPKISAGDLCEYRRVADRGVRFAMPVVGIKLYPTTSKASFESESTATAKTLKVEHKAVTGYGDEAFQQGDLVLAIRKGDTAFTVTHWNPKVDAAKVDAVARKALTRI